MTSRKKWLPFIYVGILELILLIYFILFLDPQENFDIGNISFSPIIVFFVLIFFTALSFFTYILLSKRRGVFAGFFFVLILGLRFLGYRELLYTIILFLIFVLIDTLIKRKSKGSFR